MTYAKALNQALHRLMVEDPRIILLGEDLADPYGGAFKVTRGLSSEFGPRVKSTPISEGAIAGLAAGLALAGKRPIAEIMFGDFLSLTFDQVVNHITKYEAMYAGKVACPVIIRAPSGGHRGYGPTHSQSLEKHFLGVPHLKVLAASLFHDPQDSLRSLLAQDQPALFVEHKLLYPKAQQLPAGGRIGDFLAEVQGGTVRLSLVPAEECALTVVAYGYSAWLAQQVIERLGMQEEVFCELVVPSCISPVDYAPILDSVGCTRRLLTVEEGTEGWSWGTEVAAQVSKRAFGTLAAPVEVLASAPDVIPGARDKEAATLVGEPQIEAAIRAAVEARR